jgi:hypothetical protein
MARNANFTKVWNEVPENLSRAKLTRDQLRFVLVLIRETIGRKNQFPGGHRAKRMPWEPQAFVANGIDQKSLYRLKNQLLSLRVIRSFEGQIGFNWHFDQWKCGWYVPLSSGSSTAPQRQKYRSTAVKVPPHSGIDSPQTLSQTASTEPKASKERKKYPSQGEKLDEEFEVFWKLWLSGLPKNAHARMRNKQQSRSAWRVLVTVKGIPAAALLEGLKKYQQWEMKKQIESAIRQGVAPDQWLPNPSTWLDRQAEDSETARGVSPYGVAKEKIISECNVLLRANEEMWQEGRRSEDERNRIDRELRESTKAKLTQLKEMYNET